MMGILYNLIISGMGWGAWLASFFNHKVKLFVLGRKKLLDRLNHAIQENKGPLVWIHCASLGEFEQGRPVIEAHKKEFPDHKVLLTFFSPSGYEVRKNYREADYIFYLPLDKPRTVKRFLDIVDPALVIFIKYEFWYNFSTELNRRNIPLLSVSSIFRSNQIFFHTYGKFFRGILKNYSYFFVQNDASVKLLNSIGLKNCLRAGDTRFDRVHQLINQSNEIPLIKKFKGMDKVMIIGSCWPEDLEVIIPFINDHYYQLKFIVAPHEVSDHQIHDLEKALHVKSIRYSLAQNMTHLDDCQVLIIDNIGMLSKLYRYGEFAFVGGAFGKGLHNILEAACYGVPVFFGDKNYEKFQEAVDLINRGGAFEISDYRDFKAKYEMINIPQNFLLACEVTRLYVEENLGATEKIMHYCRDILTANVHQSKYVS
jgi:3-deoxy-D-manno-octulosonic-acid transferase